MIASAMSQQTVQECLDEDVSCSYKVPPTAVCGRNKDGIEYRFIGQCEFNHVNRCVQPEGIDFVIMTHSVNKINFKNIF